ncbi:hypothetical protein ACSAZL_07655 [Methanosarcina sp. T3]|uniref:hypothetical protein n=1 Tax=Methanosarcina sp. T3 TaxID=3439062 RepID=UPI003F86A4D3
MRYSSTAALPSKIAGYMAGAAQEVFHKIAAGAGPIPKVPSLSRAYPKRISRSRNQTWQNLAKSQLSGVKENEIFSTRNIFCQSAYPGKTL